MSTSYTNSANIGLMRHWYEQTHHEFCMIIRWMKWSTKRYTTLRATRPSRFTMAHTRSSAFTQTIPWPYAYKIMWQNDCPSNFWNPLCFISVAPNSSNIFLLHQTHHLCPQVLFTQVVFFLAILLLLRISEIFLSVFLSWCPFRSSLVWESDQSTSYDDQTSFIRH